VPIIYAQYLYWYWYLKVRYWYLDHWYWYWNWYLLVEYLIQDWVSAERTSVGRLFLFFLALPN